MSPIDQFRIEYTNGAIAPAPPGGQAISMHDITMCPRRLPDVTANKIIEIYDPLDKGLYNIPGNEVIYTLMIENNGEAETDEDSLFLVDNLPEEVVFFNGASTTIALVFIQSFLKRQARLIYHLIQQMM